MIPAVRNGTINRLQERKRTSFSKNYFSTETPIRPYPPPFLFFLVALNMTCDDKKLFFTLTGVSRG